MPDYAGVIFQTLSVLYSRGDFDAYKRTATVVQKWVLNDAGLVIWAFLCYYLTSFNVFVAMEDVFIRYTL